MSFDTMATVVGRALRIGTGLGLLVGGAVGLVGLAVAGAAGLWSGLVGAGLTIVFLGVTAVGMRFAARLPPERTTLAFGVLMGAWFLKLVVFVLVMIALRQAAWIVPGVLFASIVGTVIVSLVTDAVVVGRARIPVTDRV